MSGGCDCPALGGALSLFLTRALILPLPLALSSLPPAPLAGFNGNQSALWTATNSKGNSFLINVHGTDNVVVGDVTIPAFTPVESEWFCDGFSALLGEQ